MRFCLTNKFCIGIVWFGYSASRVILTPVKHFSIAPFRRSHHAHHVLVVAAPRFVSSCLSGPPRHGALRALTLAFKPHRRRRSELPLIAVEFLEDRALLSATANDDSDYMTVHDQPLTESAPGVLNNDIADMDSDGMPLPMTASLVSGPANGSVTLNGDGSFVYTPNAGFVGVDTFTYNISGSNNATVTINVLNNAPSASDDSYMVLHDQTLNEAASGVLGNDSGDMDGDPVTAILVDDVTHGTLVFNADGSFDYTPNAGYVGIDSFTYKLNDGLTDGNTATVTINVLNATPSAYDDSYSLTHDRPFTLDAPGILANDFDMDGDPLTISLVDHPEHGYVLINSDGSFDYYPDEEYVGEDNFTYTISDGISESPPATVTLSIVNAAPTAVHDFLGEVSARVVSYFDLSLLLENDFDSDDEHDLLVIDSIDSTSALGASVSIVSGQLRYDPTGVPALQSLSDYDIASDIIGYAIKDPHSQLAFASMNLDVTKNRPPTISQIPDQITLKDKPTAALKFIAKDYPGETPDNAVVLTATSSNQAVVPNSGLAISTIMGAQRQIIVTPAVGAVGEATITVTVDDTDGKTASTTFKVTVEANLRLIGIAIVNGASLIGEGPNIASNYDAAGAPVAATGYAHFRAVLNDASQGTPLPAGFTITWTGGDPAFSGSDLERKVDRQTAQKVTLTASDNFGNTFGMYVYIVGVTHTGFNATAGAAHSPDNNPASGRRYRLGLRIDDDVRGKIHGGMESQWTVSPAALIGDQGTLISGAGINFDPKREYLVLRYRRTAAGIQAIRSGDDDSGTETQSWVADGTSSTDNTPWGSANGHLYFNDQPGTNSNSGPETLGLMFYHNFREWWVVRIGGESAPSDKFAWHYFQAVERNSTTGRFQSSATGTNSIGPGNLFWGSLPTELNNRLPTFTTTTLANGQSNVAYSQQISASAAPDYPTAPLKFAIVEGSLPDGLTLDPDTGMISGTTIQDGVFTFKVKVWQDIAGSIANYLEFTLTVTM